MPVVNENDTVVNDEIKFGDNDTLGALVTNLLDADALVILTDQAGLFSADPRKDPAARLVERGAAGDPALERMAGGAGSAIGRGGMLTKVLAAKRAARSGASTVIASGREPDVLLRLAAGESIGTALRRDDRQGRRAQALDERPPAAARRGRSSTTAPPPSCATAARACCRSASSASRAISTAATSSPCAGRAARRSAAASATTAAPKRG